MWLVSINCANGNHWQKKFGRVALNLERWCMCKWRMRIKATEISCQKTSQCVTWWKIEVRYQSIKATQWAQNSVPLWFSNNWMWIVGNYLSAYIVKLEQFSLRLERFCAMYSPNGINGIGKIVGNVFSMARLPIVPWPGEGTSGVLL